MKGTLTLKALECLADGAVMLDNLITVFTSPYGSSMHSINRRLVEAGRERERYAAAERERRAFQNLVYRLERDGLAKAAGRGTAKRLSITSAGWDMLEVLRLRAKTALPQPVYTHEPSRELKIVAFDVPERERQKRAWLREALRTLNFTILQQSLWIGTAAVPREFLEDLRRHRLLPFVHIFAVSKTGSLKELR